jgi:hypothetical protein
MQIGTEIRNEIVEALLAAFPLPGRLEAAVDLADLGYSFEEFLAVPGTTKSFAVRNLVVQAAAEDQLVKLIKSARIKNSGNPKIKAVWAKLEISDQEFDRLGADFGHAEKVLFSEKPFEDVAPWLARLGEARRAVCRVEPQPESNPLKTRGYGSGFLIAPNVVMTNYHVAEDFWNNPAKAGRVRVRFDFERAADSPAVSAGNEFALASGWPDDGGGMSGERKYPWQCVCSPVKELDFALLRVKGPAEGRKPLVPVAHPFRSPESLIILQHPNATPLQLAFGSVTAEAPAPNRVAYTVNTEGGSSGAPVFSQDLRLVAIHHWGGNDHNRGVTQAAILAFLRTKKEQLATMDLGDLVHA